MPEIKRDFYLHQLVDSRGDGQIKIITGLRRCGKSYLLHNLFGDFIKANGVNPSNIITFQLNKKKDAAFRRAIPLSNELERRIALIKGGVIYIFIDEIQLCLPSVDPNDPTKLITFYDVLSDYQGESGFDVYVTGSNSHLLSKDVATDFRGKGKVIEVHPLSFSEYHAYKRGEVSKDYGEYFTFGGMPYLVAHCQSEEEKEKYLKDLFQETYIKDIRDNVNAEREDVLNELVLDLCSSVGSLTNPNKIAKTLKSEKNIAVTDDTIASYLSGCVNSFLFGECKRYDVKGKKYFSYPSKYYCADIGLRNCWLNLRQQEETHIMENIIFSELVSRGLYPDVGVVDIFGREKDGKTSRTTTEIDFVINAPGGNIYIQSAFNIDDPAKKAKELRPLLNIRNYKKRIVITRSTPKPYVDDDGITYCSITDFLLGPGLID